MPLVMRILATLRGLTRPRGRMLLLMVLGLLIYGTLGFCWFESEGPLAELSPPRRLETAAWWTIVSMTTVGYGDVYPSTWQGRWLVGVPLLVLGIGILGYAIGMLTGAVIERQTKEMKGMVPYTRSGHIVICNCPSIDLVLEIARELGSHPAWRGRDVVLVTDALTDGDGRLRDAGIHLIAGNPCREQSLLRANLAGAHRVMVLTQHPEDDACDTLTLGVLVTIRSLRPDVFMVVECHHSENMKLLRAARADEIVSTASLRAELIVQGLQAPGVNELIEELLSNTRGAQIYVLPVSEFRGTYDALREQLRRKGNYVALGVVHQGVRRLLPPGDAPVEPGDSLILVAEAPPDRV